VRRTETKKGREERERGRESKRYVEKRQKGTIQYKNRKLIDTDENK